MNTEKKPTFNSMIEKFLFNKQYGFVSYIQHLNNYISQHHWKIFICLQGGPHDKYLSF